MFITSVIVVLSLLILLIIQVHWANRFVALYSQKTVGAESARYRPHVGVILALRGADPFLESCLRGLFSQNYDSYEIRIIVDSEVDPSFAVVNRVVQETSARGVEVEILDVCQETSSLKNAALIQGISGCSERCEAFAWLDSDTVPHEGWLRSLIAPLHEERIGVTCGVRWYAPPTMTIANYVRHIWNAAAVLQMVEFEIGWGGAFAIRKSVYEESGLEDKWRRALVEDTLASDVVRSGGRRVRFIPECTMSNPESASLKWCISFVTRQLQGLRYYHSAWRRVLWFGLMSGIAILGCLGLWIASLAAADTYSALVTGGGLLMFGTVACWLMYRSEKRVNRFFARGGSVGLSNPLMLTVSAPVAQIVHLIALIRAFWLTDVTWRGIQYHIRSGMDLVRMNYQPYAPDAGHDKPQHSL